MQRGGGWKSRYVPEYSTIGQSPEEVCESVDAHYRAARGYFQSFWSASCPLVNRDLGLFYRAMYCSRCFLAFAAGAPLLVWSLFGLLCVAMTRCTP